MNKKVLFLLEDPERAFATNEPLTQSELATISRRALAHQGASMSGHNHFDTSAKVLDFRTFVDIWRREETDLIILLCSYTKPFKKITLVLATLFLRAEHRVYCISKSEFRTIKLRYLAHLLLIRPLLAAKCFLIKSILTLIILSNAKPRQHVK